MRWEYTQLRFVPRGKSWTGEIEELWLDDRQLISRSHPQRDVTLVGLMNELGEQGWELVTYAQPFTGYHGGCYTFKRQKRAGGSERAGVDVLGHAHEADHKKRNSCLLYTSPSPRDKRQSRMPSSA